MELLELKKQSKIILNQSQIKNQSDEVNFDLGGNVNLYINWYDEQNIYRLSEYKECLVNNFLNSCIDKIYVLCEKVSPPNIDVFSKRFEFVQVLQRPTYQNIFEIVNRYTTKDDINIIANTDIYFDDSLKYIDPTLNSKTVYCLTRWNVDTRGQMNFHNRKDSQDVWIFRGKISKIIGGNFTMGIAGCDNKIAYELEKSGYKLMNPSLSIKALHLHNVNVRNYINNGVVKRVSPPYQCITPSLLGNFRIKEKIKSNSEKSILHIGLNTSYQKSLNNALATLGNYFIVDWRSELEHGNLQSLYRKILGIINEFNIDLIFLQVQTPNIITKELIEHINIISPDTKIINWSGDIRLHTPQWMIDLAKFHNVYTSFTNYRDVEYMLKLGYKNTFYMPMSYEETVFTTHEPKKNKMPSIVFIGSNYGIKFPLTDLRSNVIIKLKEKYQNNFQVYGNGWNGVGEIKYVHKSYSNFIYRSAKIALSINNINAYKYTSDRMFNIMASRCFCLAHYYEGIEINFKKGFHLDWWNNMDELIDKIQYYLIHTKERRQIAQQGYDEVIKNHKWINRIDIIKKEILYK